MHGRAPGFLIGLITLLVAMGPLTVSIYIPSLTDIRTALGATEAEVQFSVTAYLVGFAFAQLAAGPLSDRFGRRPVLFSGLGLFIAASVACALAESAAMLAAMRVVQAVGACTGPVVGRAMVRDLFPPERARSVFALVGTAIALAPAIAPVLGGLLQTWFGWEANFYALALIGVALFAIMLAQLHETNLAKDPLATSVRGLAAGYRTLLRDRGFVGYSMVVGFTFFGMFAYTANSPFVLRDLLGVGAADFGLLALFNVAAYVIGTLVANRLARRHSLDAVMTIGAVVSALGGLAMLAVTWLDLVTVASILGAMMVYVAGMGLVLPNGFAGALGPFPRIAGAASAVMGFAQMGVGALGTVAVAMLADGSARPLGLVVAAGGAATLATALATARRPRPRPA